jgi:hypothetical protein
MRRRTKAVGVVACAATLSLSLGIAATAGAGASTPKHHMVASPKVMEANAVNTALTALRASSHLKSEAAREKAVRTALQHLQAAIKVATANVKPSAAALRDATSLATRRAEKLGHPGSLAVHTTVTGVRASYTPGFSTSSNWSGYVDTGGTFNYVFGEWQVPSANCGPWYDFNFSQSSTWVGLDGWGNGTVEQLGTATGCIAGASAYYAWTEMYPQIEDPIFNGIAPGDQMMAFVYSYNNGTADELWEADLSQGWSYVRYAGTSQVQDSSAEWITEDPSCWAPCYNLTNFGSMTFTDAYAEDQNTFGSISAFPNSMIDMNKNNTWCAAVGWLTNGGTQFTDWWYHS